MAKTIGDAMAKLRKALGKAVDEKQLRALGDLAVKAIVKRTRDGYGVSRALGSKERLKPLSRSYIEFRSTQKLHPETTPSTSNLTFSGQMLDSVRVIRVTNGKIVIGPTGSRSGGLSNAKVVSYNADKGRIFLNLSMSEFKQILVEYRKTFSSLFKK